MSEQTDAHIKLGAISSTGEKLNTFIEGLSEQEQLVMRWILDRAEHSTTGATAEPSEVEGYANQLLSQPGGLQTQRFAHQQTFSSVGLPQFGQLAPGRAAAGSSIGVTGTIMF